MCPEYSVPQPGFSMNIICANIQKRLLSEKLYCKMKVLDSWVLEICQLFWLLFVSSQLISYGYFMVSSRVLGREQICKCDLCCTMLELVFAWASLSCDFLSIWYFTFKTSLHFSFAHLSSCPQHLSTLWCNVLFTLHQFRSIIKSLVPLTMDLSSKYVSLSWACNTFWLYLFCSLALKTWKQNLN